MPGRRHPFRRPLRRRRGGFSLIELLIAVAVVGLLAAVAIPAYQHYTKRSRMANVFLKMNDYRTRAMEYLAAHGRFPPSETHIAVGQWHDNNGVDFLAMDINYSTTNPDPVNTVEIIAFLRPSVFANGQLSLRGVRDASGNVAWTCGQMSYDNVPNTLLPRECRR